MAGIGFELKKLFQKRGLGLFVLPAIVFIVGLDERNPTDGTAL